MFMKEKAIWKANVTNQELSNCNVVYGVAQFAAGRFCNFDEKGARRKRSDQKAVLQMDQKATTKFD